MLIGGGLAALGLLPGSGWGWLVPPQIAIGAGLALALGALTEAALAGRSPLAIHGGWTMAARHAGVCAGLLILTPLFTSDLQHQQTLAELAGARLIIESPLSFSDKYHLGGAILHTISSGPVTKPPNLDPAFRPFAGTRRDRPAEAGHPRRDPAGGHACVQPQLPGGGAAGAAGGAAPGAPAAADMSRPVTFVAAAAVAAALLVGAYVAAGGTSYRPSASPDPCAPRHWPPVSGATQIAEQMTLSALAGAACTLGVRPEELTIAFANQAGLQQFAREHHISRSRLDDAARPGSGGRSTTASEAAR